MARTLGAPVSVPAGKSASKASKASRPSPSSPLTWETRCIRCQKRSTCARRSTRTRARYRHASDVVASRGPRASRARRSPCRRPGSRLRGAVLLVGRAARSRARDGSSAHDAVVHAHQHLGRGTDDLVVAAVEQVHVGRGVERAQHPVERQRVRPRSRRRNCWLGTTWKTSPATDVLLGAFAPPRRTALG